MEKTTVTLPKKMPLVMRISEASRHVRNWLQTIDVGFNEERDKLQLTQWELIDGKYHYHYSIINRKELSASAVNNRKGDQTLETYGTTDLQGDSEEVIADVYPDSDLFL